MRRISCLIFFAFLSFSNASDNTYNVIFDTLTYPIETITTSSEKDDFIIYETPYSNTFSYSYNTVILHGETENISILIEMWIKAEKQNEIKLKPKQFKIYKNGRFWATFSLDNLTKHPFKIVFKNITANRAFKIIIYEIQAIKVPGTKPEITLSTTAYIPDPSLFLPESLPFHLIKRNIWNAAPPKEPYTPHIPMAITIHHTAGRYTLDLEQSLAEIQFIQDYHQNGRGWIDIGYHFLIDPLGNIFEGRPLKVIGAHVAGKNTNNIGISVMGYYHPPKDNQVSSSTLNSIIILAKYLSENYTITKSSFYAHRDLGKTDCPGNILYPYMKELSDIIFKEIPNENFDITTFTLPYTEERTPVDQLLKESQNFK